MDIVAGIIALLLPAAAALALLYLVSAWSILTGVFRIAAAIRLRRHIQSEWLLIVNGVLSVLFGIIVVVYPAAGVVTVAWIIGMYAILFGAMLVALGFRLRGHAGTGPVRTGAR